MHLYSVKNSNVALSTTADIITLTGGEDRSLIITEIDAQGMGTASAANEIALFGVSSAGVTPTAITPTPLDVTSPAMVGTAASSFATPPTVNTAVYHTIPLNANGQRYFWRAQNIYDVIAMPGGAVAGSQRSFRSTVGTSNASLRVRLLEV